MIHAMTYPPLISGPVPPYNNPPIMPQDYSPRTAFIEDITLGQTTNVEATTDLEFVVGQLVRLLIPPGFGCRQLNEVTGYVIDLVSSTTVTVAIDSSVGVDPFVSNPTARNQPQIVPVGDVNLGVVNATGRRNTGTYIPGSFIHIPCIASLLVLN